ncbi:MAG TPA: DUF4143 domain-containing protein, partial [Spirochaetia bacterium]|nr:DUF4143 domain-containing protein [Spirochaetia bacterium]
THRDLMSHPDYGASWENFALESICSQAAVRKKYRCFFYGVHSGGEIDLVLDDGSEKIAVEFKASSAPDVPGKYITALGALGITRAWIVAPVKTNYPAAHGIMVGPPMDLIRELS